MQGFVAQRQGKYPDQSQEAHQQAAADNPDEGGNSGCHILLNKSLYREITEFQC